MGFKPGKGAVAGDFKITTGSVLLKEMSTAAPDIAGFGQLWVKSNEPNDLYFVDDSGQEIRITNDGNLASAGGTLSGLGSTDNAVARASGTGGETIQGSSVIISDAGVVSGSSYTGYATRTTTVEVTSVSASSAQAATLSGSAATIDNLTLGNTAVTSDAGELNLLDGASAETIVNSKAVIYGNIGEVTGSTFKGSSVQASTGEFTGINSASIHIGSNVSASTEITGGWHRGHTIQGDSGIFTTLSGSAATLDNITLGNTAISADAGEINLLDGAAAETIANSKAVIYGNIGEVTGSTFKGFSVQAKDGLFTAPVSASLFKGSMVSASLLVSGGWHKGFKFEGTRFFGSFGIYVSLSGSAATFDNITLGNTAITSDAGEINLLDGASAETIVNSKAVIYGNIGEVSASTFKGFSVQASSGEFVGINSASVHIGSNVSASTVVTGGWHKGYKFEGSYLDLAGIASASVYIGSNLSASTEITGGWHRGFKLEGDNGVFGVLSGSTATVENITIKNTDRVIDLDKTGNSTAANTITGIKVDLDNSTATNGTNTMIGASLTPTMTHAANAGAPTVKGLEIVATGHGNGTSICRGIDIISTGADFNQGVFVTVDNGTGPAFKAVSSADSGDFMSIAVGANGATTIKSVDDDNGSADMIMEADGDFKIDAKALIQLDSETGDIHFLDNGATMLALDFDSTSGSIGADLIFKVEDDAKNLVFQQNDGKEVARMQHSGSLGANFGSFSVGFAHKRPVAEVVADGAATTATLTPSMSGYIINLIPVNDDIIIILPAGDPGIYFDFWLGEAVPGGKTVKIRTAGTDNADSIYGHFNVPGGSHAFTSDFTGDVLTLQASTAKGAWVRMTNIIPGSNEVWHAEVISSVVALVDNT